MKTLDTSCTTWLLLSILQARTRCQTYKLNSYLKKKTLTGSFPHFCYRLPPAGHLLIRPGAELFFLVLYRWSPGIRSISPANTFLEDMTQTDVSVCQQEKQERKFFLMLKVSKKKKKKKRKPSSYQTNFAVWQFAARKNSMFAKNFQISRSCHYLVYLLSRWGQLSNRFERSTGGLMDIRSTPMHYGNW